MAAEVSGRRFGTGFIFRDSETWGDAGWPAVVLTIVILAIVVLAVIVLASTVLPVVLLPVIVLLNGERGRQQALKGLLVQHQSGSGRRHVFGREANCG